MLPDINPALIYGVFPFRDKRNGAPTPDANRYRLPLAASHRDKLPACPSAAPALHVAIQAMSGSPVTFMRKFSLGIAADGGSS